MGIPQFFSHTSHNFVGKYFGGGDLYLCIFTRAKTALTSQIAFPPVIQKACTKIKSKAAQISAQRTSSLISRKEASYSSKSCREEMSTLALKKSLTPVYSLPALKEIIMPDS